MGGREDVDLVLFVQHFAGQWDEGGDAFDLVAEEFDAYRILFVHGEDLQHVPAYPEITPLRGEVVAVVLDVDEMSQQSGALVFLADS